jgi:hypothetical protein
MISSFNSDQEEGSAVKQAAPSQKNRSIFGILLIILGLAGLVIPVIPGWIFVLAGLAMV